MDVIDKFLQNIDEELAKYPLVEKLELQTKIPKAYGAVGALFCLVLFIFFNVAGSFITTVIGFAYPAYASMKALQTPEGKDDIQWYNIHLTNTG